MGGLQVSGALARRMQRRARLSGTISAMIKNPKHALISASTGFALLALAMGAAAVGAMAVGAVAVGAFTIGKLGFGKAELRSWKLAS